LHANVQAPTINEFASHAAGTIQAFVFCASQYSAAFTHTLVGGLPTAIHPNPLGQSDPDAQAAVQYPGPSRHPKLQALALVHDFPISLIVQNFSLPTAEQRIPEGQPPSVTQFRVHRDGPFFHMERQRSDDTHSGSAPHKSSSPLVPPPPLLLDELLDELDDELLDEELLDETSPLLDDELLVTSLLDELPIPPLPPVPLSGKHWPERHRKPGLQSRSLSAHSRLHVPSTQAPSMQ
jgi:hypothetical protein